MNRSSSNKLSLEMLPIGSLIPDPKNARLHPEKHIKQLAKSIESFGFNCPLLIDEHNNVIAGHGRLLAIKQMGWTEVPVIRLEHLTPMQLRAFSVADNRLTDCSSWDPTLLAQQLKMLSEADLDFDIEAIGFDAVEIDLLIQNLGDTDEEPDPADLQPSSAPAVSRLGDVWVLGPHRIACGDALEAGSYDLLMGSRKAAMVFSDPPWNVPIAGHVGGNGRVQHREFPMASGEMTVEGFAAFLTQAVGHLKRYSVDGALLYLCIDWRHLIELSAAGTAHALELKNIIIWDKGCGGMGSFYRSQHEMIFLFKSGTAKHINNVLLGRYGRNRCNVWSYPGANSFARETSEGNLLDFHPTTKPLALVADAILDATQRGDRVLDAFLGSGTTVIAAEKTGRVALGIELDPRYVDVAIRRWQKLTCQQAVHADTNQTFAQLEQERGCADSNVSTLTPVEGETA